MRPSSRKDFFDIFGPPNLRGGWPLAGLCSSAFFALVRQAKMAEANKKAAEEAAKKAAEEAAQVRSHTGCIGSSSQCERHVLIHALSGNNTFIHTHTECAVHRTPPCDCACVCVRRGGKGGMGGGGGGGGSWVCVRMPWSLKT
jgi:hypothetical protein